MIAVAAAGPLMNLLMATLGALAIGLLVRGGVPAEASLSGFLILALVNFLLINVFLAFFNLLPIPPFDGSHILEGLLPRPLAAVYERLRPVGLLLFFGLVALTWFGPTSGVLDHLIGPPVDWIMGVFGALVEWVSGGFIPGY
jgi:Zn-dependent protease